MNEAQYRTLDELRTSPHAVAIADGNEYVTHARLRVRANAFAARLRDAGVGPEVRVGVLLEPSTDLVVSVLAIWIAGGAYVPLDPASPREQLETMLRDASIGALVSHPRWQDKLTLMPSTVFWWGDALWRGDAESESDLRHCK